MTAKSKDTESISFDALVSQVRTMADGGLRFQLDVSEGHVYEAAWLMEVKQDEGIVKVTVNR